MKKDDKFKSNIFDNSRLEESTTYSKREVIEDIKDKSISMLPKGISIFRSKGLFGFAIWTYLVFSSLGYKNSTIELRLLENILNVGSNGGYIYLTKIESLLLSFYLLVVYVYIWRKINNRNTRMENI